MKGSLSLLLLSLFLALLPVPAAAKEFPAGFPGGALWLSKTSPISGEEVRIYATLFNSGDSALTGTLVFFVDDTALASKPVSLGAGEAKIESAVWQAKEGEYAISAKIENSEGGGQSLELTGKVSGSVVVVVAKPPEPSAIVQGVGAAANFATEAVSAAAPSVLGAATTFYEKAEDVREAGVARLEKYVSNTEKKDSSAGANTQTASTSLSAVSGFEAPEKESIVSQVAKAGAQVALFIMKIKFLFYPVILLLILFIISMLFKWASRRPV